MIPTNRHECAGRLPKGIKSVLIRISPSVCFARVPKDSAVIPHIASSFFRASPSVNLAGILNVINDRPCCSWSHADLTKLDRDHIVSEMDQLSTALQNIIGKVPRYMRPPYFATNDFVLQTMKELNFHVIHASIDTLDYNNDSEALIGNAVNNFKNGLDAGGTIELSHDVHQWTANTLVQVMIDELKARGRQGNHGVFFFPRTLFLVHLQL